MHKFWHSRGYLPHFDQPGRIQSLIFRLADSLPTKVLHQRIIEKTVKKEKGKYDNPQDFDTFIQIDTVLDKGRGQCLLADKRVAYLVESALHFFDGKRYRLLAWCIMPNHVHVLIETFPGYPLGSIVHSWKSFTSKEVNGVLHQQKNIWMPDYFDRYIRTPSHLYTAIAYIEQNPVKAGLCQSASDWEWSSARELKLG